MHVFEVHLEKKIVSIFIFLKKKCVKHHAGTMIKI